MTLGSRSISSVGIVRLTWLVCTLAIVGPVSAFQKPSLGRPSDKVSPEIVDAENGPQTVIEGQAIESIEKQPLKPVFEVRGRIDTDVIIVNQSVRNKEILGDIENSTGFRRARLGAQGAVGESVNWVAEFDFANGKIGFRNMYVGIEDLPLVRRVRIGNMDQPFSLEGFTNPSYFTFCERSPIMSLDPAQEWGIGFFSYDDEERVTFTGTAYRSGTNGSGNDSTDSNDMAYAIRVTALPWYNAESNGRRFMHVGAAFIQQFSHNDVVVIGQGPQTNLLPNSDNPSSPFVPTIMVPANQSQLYNVEWAVVLGSLSFQAEWSATHIDQIGGGPVFIQGCYLFASLFLTGENRSYLTKDGCFGPIQVRSPFLSRKDGKFCTCGLGAWEVAVRFAIADYKDANIPPTINGLKVGDRSAETTLGLNWYLNDNARIMFNYLHAIPVDPNFGPSAGDGIFVRTAIYW